MALDILFVLVHKDPILNVGRP